MRFLLMLKGPARRLAAALGLLPVIRLLRGAAPPSRHVRRGSNRGFDVYRRGERVAHRPVDGHRDPCRTVTFGITLASSRSVPDWQKTELLLAATLRSIQRQTCDDYRIIIAGHELPDIPEIVHPSVEFLSLRSAPAVRPSQFRADKARKRHALGARLRELGGGYFMQLDADDLVHRDLARRCLEGGGPGYIASSGFAYDWQTGLIAPVPGVWPFDFDRVCGSCAVVFYKPDDLPTPASETNDQSIVFNMTRQHAYIRVACEELGRPLRPLDIPMIVYVLNHAQNLSFQLQKKSSRGQTIIARIAEQCLTADEEIGRIGEDFGLEAKAPSRLRQAAG